MTVPKYKKSASKGDEPTTTLINFNMVCHGLSQNTKNHQLTSYRDVIMGKSYDEICDNLAVKLIYEPYAIYRLDKLVFKNGKMDLPFHPVPQYLKDNNQISLDSEMVQTFVEHCGITHVDIAREGVNRQMRRKDVLDIMSEDLELFQTWELSSSSFSIFFH